MAHERAIKRDLSEEEGYTQFEAVVHGYVQGVNFRHYTRQHALQLGLSGYVENKPDGTVYVLAQGERNDLLALLAWLGNGPRAAEVSHVDARWGMGSVRYSGFEVHH
jgi:acylphosphatase